MSRTNVQVLLGWFGTLECAPLNVSNSILPGANVGGLVWLVWKKIIFLL